MALIRWDQPDSDEDVLHVEIYYCTTENGTYTKIVTIDAKDGDGNWVTEYDDTAHTSGWYKIRFLNTAETPSSYSTAREVAYSLLSYTTVALVKKQVEALDTGIIDPTIEDFILNAESLIDSIMKASLKTTFNESKHGLLRSLATKLAAVDCINYDIDTQFGTSAGGLLLDSLKMDIDEYITKLTDQKVVKYLESL